MSPDSPINAATPYATRIEVAPNSRTVGRGMPTRHRFASADLCTPDRRNGRSLSRTEVRPNFKADGHNQQDVEKLDALRLTVPLHMSWQGGVPASGSIQHKEVCSSGLYNRTVAK